MPDSHVPYPEELRPIRRTARYILIAYLATLAFVAVATVARAQSTTPTPDPADACPGIPGIQKPYAPETELIEGVYCQHGFPPMSLGTFRERRWDLLGWTNRALRNRCRPTLSFKVGSSEIRFWRRDENLDRWTQKNRRAHELSDRCVPWYVTKQIAIANKIGAESGGDPWPNCPDPFDGGGASWYDTVACENRAYHELYGFPREFLDSPGYYRCGLQFDPGWETKYGRLCP